MGKLEIINKLNNFLKLHNSITEECHVVYLMVEIRKILDHDKNSRYPLLRFYCDWTVHTEKDRITKEMKKIMEEIYKGVVYEITDYPASRKTKIVSFMYMEDLKEEMREFLNEYNLPVELVNEKDKWLTFVSLFVKILADQPINKPTNKIEFFSFYPAASGCVLGEVRFKCPVNINGKKYPSYNFGNAY